MLLNTPTTVVDTVMGSGKSQWAIQELSLTEQPTIIIVELESEVMRYVDALPNFTTPAMEVEEGENLTKTFQRLVKEGRSVVTTHALFGMWTPATLSHIRGKKYQLVMDEVVSDIIKVHKIPSSDIEKMLESELIALEDTETHLSLSELSNPDALLSRYDWMKEVYRQREVRIWKHKSKSGDETYRMYSVVHPRFFKAFQSITVLTYLFKDSLMDVLFGLHDIPYEHKSVFGEEHSRYLGDYMGASGAQFADQITIHGTKSHNEIGQKKGRGNPLSKSSLVTPGGKPKAKPCAELQKVFMNVEQSWRRASERKGNTWSREDIMWTTHKQATDAVAYRKFDDGELRALDAAHKLDTDEERGKVNFVAKNRRATNLYAKKHYLMYGADILLDPDTNDFLAALGYSLEDRKVIEDTYALSTLIQWVWRSAIRVSPKEHITVFIPSQRMRKLFTDWLGMDEVK